MTLLRFASITLLAGASLALAGCAPADNIPVAPALTPTTTSLTAGPNPVSSGSYVSLTAVVAGGQFAASDQVSFYDGTTLLGSATLGQIPATGPAPASVPPGTAVLNVNTLLASTTHTITAKYTGDAIHSGSTSGAVSIVVTGSAAPTMINAHATFTFTTPNQTIAGFGVAEAFDLQSLDQAPYASEMYKALFDPTSGLGLTFLRVQDLYRGTPTGFDNDTPAIVSAANTAHGTPLTILMSSWSPPANLKSNGSVNGCTTITNGACTGGIGTLLPLNGSYDYADFATYWLNSLSAYAALGVTPAYISIQNEPDFTATYTGCRFNPTEATYQGTNYAGYGLAFDAVYKKLQTMTTPPKMVGPETLSPGASALALGVQIPAGEAAVIAHHMYDVPSGSISTGGVVAAGGSPDGDLTDLTNLNAAYPTTTKWATEYYDTPGFFDAWTINNALTVGNDNAYIYWQGVWPSQLESAGDQAGDQEGVLYAGPVSTTFPHGWGYNDSYYALKHFSYFVRPGYVRYNAVMDNTDERVSVYQSSDKKTTVIVVLNTSASATDGLSLNLSNISYASSVVYRSSFMTPILTGERWNNLGGYLAPSSQSGANNNGGINLPPYSAVTIVLTN